MLNKVDMKNLMDVLKKDEVLGRLIVYNDNPLDLNKEEVLDRRDTKDELEDRLSFTPQSFQLKGKEEKIRLHISKAFTKPKFENPPRTKETIYINFFIPQRIQDNDLRSYDLEERIANLLSDELLKGKIGELEYTDGYFIPLPSISGYTQYNMVFTMKDGFVNYAEY